MIFTIVPNDIRGHRVIYDHPAKTCEEDPAVSFVIHKWNWQVPRPFLTVKNGRGACRFQWRVSPSFCEYSGVTYDPRVGSFFGRKSEPSPSWIRCKPYIIFTDGPDMFIPLSIYLFLIITRTNGGPNHWVIYVPPNLNLPIVGWWHNKVSF